MVARAVLSNGASKQITDDARDSHAAIGGFRLQRKNKFCGGAEGDDTAHGQRLQTYLPRSVYRSILPR